jgi:uncharacterized delta-60 repeat protein
MKNSPRRTFALAYLSLIAALALLLCHASHAQAGTLDTSFGVGGGMLVSPTSQYDSPNKVFILPNGKILIAGNGIWVSFHIYSPTPILIRLNPDGMPDSTFGTNGSGSVNTQLGNFYALDTILQPDGKIVMVGGANMSWNTPARDFAIIRFNSDGSRDTSFGTNGLVITGIGGSYDTAVGVVYLPDGKLLVSGFTYGTQTSPGAIDFVRYNADGTLDQTFGEGGIIYYLTGSINSTPGISGMVRLPDGKLLINAPGYFARFNADTTLDTTFGTDGYAYGVPGGTMNFQPDGKILISGYATQQCCEYVFSLSRFKQDGSPDVNFGTNGTVLTPFRRNTTGYAEAVAVQAAVKSNGDIVVVGSARLINTLFNGDRTSAMAVAAYTSTGTLIAKTAIAFPPYPESNGYAIAVQPDDKIIIAGPAGADAGIARLLTVTNDPRPYRRIYDFDADLRTEMMIYRPGSGGVPSVWYNFGYSEAPAFGQEGDIITPADFNDDGKTDIAVFRPSNGTWYIASNNNDPLNNFTSVQWGQNGDVPVAGDYDGDGKADVAVFRPSNGYWYILYSADNSLKAAPFGLSGDKPVVGDYDGDGKCDVAVWRPSNGTWYIVKSSTGEVQIVQFGADGDIPAQNDYNGDNKTDLVVFRPATGIWYTSTDPATNYGAVQFGRSGDIPIVGDYDADGKADIAVWRSTNRVWYVRRSSNSTLFSQQWGASTDIPVPGN